MEYYRQLSIFLHNSGNTIGAESPLARPHTHPQITPEVVDDIALVVRQAGFNLRPCHQFAFANKLIFRLLFLQLSQSTAQRVIFAPVRRHKYGLGGAARTLCVEFVTYHIYSLFSHQTIGGPFAAGNGDKIVNTITQAVIQ